MTAERVRIGMVGCGLIAQVMHLPNLRALPQLFEVAALCDLNPRLVHAVGEAYGVANRTSSVDELLELDLDAVMVLTSGSHAPAAIAAARAGRHVFVEKPMCLSVAEGTELIAEVERAGVRLMVGYMKRYDPAYERLADELGTLGPLRAVRLTTLESPLEPYVQHVPLVRAGPLSPETLAAIGADDADRVRAAIGDVEPNVARAYRERLLDSMVHELNAARGLLGDPDRVDYANIRPEGVTVVLRFGELECVASWVDLPGIARYRQEWSFVGSDRRALLEFPSPFLRNAPTSLSFEDGVAGAVSSSRSEHIVSFQSAFERELVEFNAAIIEDREPRTSARDGLKDVALCASLVRAHVGRAAVHDPVAT